MSAGEIVDAEEVWTEADPEADEVAKTVEWLSAERRPAVSTVTELKDVIAGLIKTRYQLPAPEGIRLIELNRRFGVTASRFGTTIRELIIELVSERVISAVKRHDVVVVWDKALHAQALSYYPLDRPELFDRRDAVTEDLVTRTLAVAKSSAVKKKPKDPWD